MLLIIKISRECCFVVVVAVVISLGWSHWICLLLHIDRISANWKPKVGWHAKSTRKSLPRRNTFIIIKLMETKKYVECVDTDEICLMRENICSLTTIKQNLFELVTGAHCTRQTMDRTWNPFRSKSFRLQRIYLQVSRDNLFRLLIWPTMKSSEVATGV